jgi:hypothetical protein
MSNFGLGLSPWVGRPPAGQVWHATPPQSPFFRPTPMPMRVAPVWQRPSQPNYAAAAWQRQLQQQREAQGRETKRQDELRRLREMQSHRGGGWRATPPAPVTNNYYTTTPATIAPVQPTVATTTPVPTTVVAPSMPAPQPDISPGASTADLGPTQDAAAANADASLPPASASPGDPAEHPVHKYGRKIIIGLVIAGAAFGGYKLYQKHKHGKHGSGHPHGHKLEGFRRRRGRR